MESATGRKVTSNMATASCERRCRSGAVRQTGNDLNGASHRVNPHRLRGNASAIPWAHVAGLRPTRVPRNPRNIRREQMGHRAVSRSPPGLLAGQPRALDSLQAPQPLHRWIRSDHRPSSRSSRPSIPGGVGRPRAGTNPTTVCSSPTNRWLVTSPGRRPSCSLARLRGLPGPARLPSRGDDAHREPPAAVRSRGRIAEGWCRPPSRHAGRRVGWHRGGRAGGAAGRPDPRGRGAPGAHLPARLAAVAGVFERSRARRTAKKGRPARAKDLLAKPRSRRSRRYTPPLCGLLPAASRPGPLRCSVLRRQVPGGSPPCPSGGLGASRVRA
jgi:hypothetical protein